MDDAFKAGQLKLLVVVILDTFTFFSVCLFFPRLEMWLSHQRRMRSELSLYCRDGRETA